MNNTIGGFVAKIVKKDFVEALARGLDVIKAFSNTSPVMTCAQVAAKVGLARPTTHRLLLTLQSLGYVRNDASGFSLTPRVVDLGMAYISARSIWDSARPHMEELVKVADQSCSISQLDGSDTVYVARVSAPKILSMTVNVGTRSPARSTSMGDVLLAGLGDDELHHALSKPSLSTLKARLSRTDEELSLVLPQVRRQGWASSDERLSFGIRAISVPITDCQGRTAAALSIAVHSTEVTIDHLHESYLPLLQAAGEKIRADWAKINELPMSNTASEGNFASTSSELN
ncbi:MAG: IclR family transcriptional regulator C-terminal domain-containing protein [Actinomycetota bacterium]